MKYKIFRTLGSLIDVFLIIVMLLTLILILKPDSVSDNSNLKALVVVSGSMEPVIPKGSLIVITKYDSESLIIDDIITFKVDIDNDGKLEMVTHYIADIQSDHEVITFKTKPNVTNRVDNWDVPVENIIGKVELSVPYLGYFALFLHNNATPVLLTLNVIVFSRLFINFLHIKGKINKKQSKI